MTTYAATCPDCAEVRIVTSKRLLTARCMPCAQAARRDATTAGRTTVKAKEKKLLPTYAPEHPDTCGEPTAFGTCRRLYPCLRHEEVA